MSLTVTSCPRAATYCHILSPTDTFCHLLLRPVIDFHVLLPTLTSGHLLPSPVIYSHVRSPTVTYLHVLSRAFAVLSCTAKCCRVLQRAVMYCFALSRTASCTASRCYCQVLSRTATSCHVMPHAVTYCHVL